MTKTDGGAEYTASAYAYVPDATEPSTWKIRMEETPGKVTVAQLGRAAAAMSSGGFRGEKAEIPSGDVAGVKAKIRAAYKRLGVADGDMPESVRMSDSPQFTIELTEAAAGEGLVRIPVAKMGRFVKGTQKFAITRATLADLVANFRKRQADTVIDYEHASEMPEVAAGDAVPAAGWLKSIEDAPDDSGILWGRAEFTARARKLIADKEVRYLSPAISYGAKDKTTGEPQGATLTSMAVTNRPFLEAMPAIALNDQAWKEIDRGDAVDDATRKGKHTVKVILTDRVACKVRVVADDGTESVLPLEGLEASPKVVRLSELTAGSDGRYDFATVACGDGVLIESGIFRAQLAQNALDGAIAAGKILPAQRKFYSTLALNDLAGFNAFVKDAPKVVDLAVQGTGAETLQMNDLEQVELEIHRLAKAKQAAGIADIATATKLVLSENPTLAERKKRLVAR